MGLLSEEFQIFAFLLLLLGFGSLLSMFPFHSWSPDGYAGAPTAVSMIHAGVLKKIGGYGLIRLGLLVLPLGAAEIVAKKAELQVVELESGHYSLCRQGENTWEDINL